MLEQDDIAHILFFPIKGICATHGWNTSLHQGMLFVQSAAFYDMAMLNVQFIGRLHLGGHENSRGGRFVLMPGIFYVLVVHGRMRHAGRHGVLAVERFLVLLLFRSGNNFVHGYLHYFCGLGHARH